jgi:hypothetical protein
MGVIAGIMIVWNIYDTANDAADTIKDIENPCLSDAAKAASVGWLIVGMADPSPGNWGKKVVKYEVGIFKNLKKRSKGDDFDIHHAPQKHPANQTVPGYDKNSAPSIAIPSNEHSRIPTSKGQYEGSPRELLAQTIRDLRNYTNVPNRSLQELITLNKQTYPDVFKK